MATELDIETLRRAGLLPMWEEEWPGQPGSPAAMRNVTPQMATPVQPASRPFPWITDVPSKWPFEPPTRQALPLGTMTEVPTGGTTITAPGGEASFTRGSPVQLAQWLASKQAEKRAQEAAMERRAEYTGRLQANQAFRAREAESLRMGAIRDLMGTNPAEAAKLLAQPTVAQTGDAEAQAFRQILQTQGLQPALAWLDQRATQRQGPLTPEQVAGRTTAEQAVRLMFANPRAFETARGGIEGQLAPVGGQPGVAAVAGAKAAGAPVPAGERQDLSQMENVVSMTNRLMADMPNYAAYFGPGRGRAGGVMEKFGGSIGIPEADPAELSMRSTIADINNRLVYMLSGKQINENEYLRLKATMPDPNLPYTTSLIRLSRFQRELQAVYDSRRRLQVAPAGEIGGPVAGGSSLSGQRTSKPDGQYSLGGRVYTVRGGVIQ